VGRGGSQQRIVRGYDLLAGLAPVLGVLYAWGGREAGEGELASCAPHGGEAFSWTRPCLMERFVVLLSCT